MPQTILQMQSKGRDRRLHPRTDVMAPVQCMFFEPDGPHLCEELQTLDVSASGLGAISMNRYYPGQRVVVSLPEGSVGRNRRMHATVARCNPHREGGFQVGLSFDGASVVMYADTTEAIRMAA